MPAPHRVSFGQKFRNILFGRPIPTSKAHHERLSVLIGLPVFASDALSSVAYATEAILAVLILHSTGLLRDQVPIALAISALIIIVAISYRQTIYAYSSGGGSYIVASDNLGQTPGLIAGAALMIDYILTVAVSVSAGVAAIVSAIPSMHAYLVPISLACTGVIAYANLRGLRESGATFAVPTYGFLIGMVVLIVAGIVKSVGGPVVAQQVLAEPGKIGKELMFPVFFIVMRSFAAGCTALTGIEAVSDGVVAFRSPEAKNASKTLAIMAVLLTFLFLGTGYLANHLPELTIYSTKNPEYRTLVSQIAAWAFGQNSFGFYYVQFATAAILILAANTSFADFPRLASFLSRDGFLPRALARQGDRLVFQNGIILLAVASAGLIWYFHGELDMLLPLYAVGVFLAFTLSQTGMVMHWRKKRSRGWQRAAVINGIGACATGIVTIIILVTKFSEGAWIVTVLLAILFVVFRSIRARYDSIAKQLSSGLQTPHAISSHTVLLLVPRMHRGTLKALNYALGLHGELRAIHVALNDKTVPDLKAAWAQYAGDVPLVVLNSPFRSLLGPVLEYVDQIHLERPAEIVTVIVPEAINTKWYHRLLQENVAFQLKLALGSRRNVVLTNVRYFLD